MGEPHVVTEIDILERFSQLKEEFRDDVFRWLAEFRKDLNGQVTTFGNIVDGNVVVLQSVQEKAVRLETDTLPALQKQIVDLETSTSEKVAGISSDFQEFQQKIIPVVLAEILVLGETIGSDTTTKNSVLLGRLAELETVLRGIQKGTSESVDYLASRLKEVERLAGQSVVDLSVAVANLSQKSNSLEEKLGVLVEAELARQARLPWYKRIARWIKGGAE